MKTPESYEKQAIKKYLDSIGAWYFSPYMAGFGKSGVGDIVGCYNSAFFSIEVNREGKEPTKIQERHMAEIEAAGGMAFWGPAEKVIENFRQRI